MESHKYCPNVSDCKGSIFPKFKIGDLNRRISEEVFTYSSCSQCKVIFLNSIPSNLGDYYPPTYYTIPSSLNQLAIGAEYERYKIEIVQRFVKDGRLLEIGPAVGTFAYLAKQAGFEVETIEMDTRCCEFLTNVVGVKAINSDDACVAIKSREPYNAIALWHVIEHLSDPWKTIEVAVDWLLPGGILAIAAPNPAAFQFQILQRFWAHLDAPRHLVLLPVELLIQKIEKLGLKTVLITTNDPGALGWNNFGWRVSLQNFFKHRLAKSSLDIVGRLITKVLSPIERTGLRGSAYTVVFQKEK